MKKDFVYRISERIFWISWITWKMAMNRFRSNFLQEFLKHKFLEKLPEQPLENCLKEFVNKWLRESLNILNISWRNLCRHSNTNFWKCSEFSKETPWRISVWISERSFKKILENVLEEFLKETVKPWSNFQRKPWRNLWNFFN